MCGNYHEVNEETKKAIIKFITSTPTVAKKSKDLGGEIHITEEKSILDEGHNDWREGYWEFTSRYINDIGGQRHCDDWIISIDYN